MKARRVHIEKRPDFVDQALDGVELLRSIPRKEIGVACDELGASYNMLARKDNDAYELYGFLTPFSLGYKERLPPSIKNVNRLRQVPNTQLQHIDRTGKGVGARLYNSQLGLEEWEDHGQPAALYRTVVRPGHIYDARRSWDNSVIGKAHRIIEHNITRLGTLMTFGIVETINRVHSSYGPDCDAVILESTR